MKLLIKNANVVDKSHDFYGDVYIENSVIKEIGILEKNDCEIIDAKGKVLMPAFIDTHAHFRDPGFTHKEDVKTGSMAAVRGGYTTVVLMGNTNPIASTREIVEDVEKRVKELGFVDAYQCATITKNLDGKTLSHLKQFKGSGLKAITDDGRGVCDSSIMYEAMNMARENDYIIMSHAEDHDLTKISMRLAENMMTYRDIELAKFTNAKLHLAHVSTKEALALIEEAKKKHSNITCEVTPHHIFFDDTMSNYRVNPPIREKEDVKSVIESIKNGTVDCIGTDHAPHTDEEKLKGAPGLTGIELSFSVCYTKLVKNEGLSLNKLSELMSSRPAEILNLKKGKIEIGYEADFALVDLDKKFTIKREKMVSKSKNTPFDGIELCADVVMTIKGGKVVYKGSFK